jgi:hypothetical protein
MSESNWKSIMSDQQHLQITIDVENIVFIIIDLDFI